MTDHRDAGSGQFRTSPHGRPFTVGTEVTVADTGNAAQMASRFTRGELPGRQRQLPPDLGHTDEGQNLSIPGVASARDNPYRTNDQPRG